MSRYGRYHRSSSSSSDDDMNTGTGQRPSYGEYTGFWDFLNTLPESYTSNRPAPSNPTNYYYGDFFDGGYNNNTDTVARPSDGHSHRSNAHSHHSNAHSHRSNAHSHRSNSNGYGYGGGYGQSNGNSRGVNGSVSSRSRSSPAPGGSVFGNRAGYYQFERGSTSRARNRESSDDDSNDGYTGGSNYYNWT